MITYKGSARLGMAHSLIVGHGPRLANLEAIKADAKKRIESFGLFNIVTPDTKTYYKDVSAEDLNPKADDYIKPIFRGLSEVIVRKQFDPIDFSNGGVLKDSMSKLLGQTIYTNHEAAVGNEVGVVSNVFWDQGYVVDGFSIPAGINFEAMIDGKIHTKLVRDIQQDPPAVHSNSVTVQFKWSQSHPKMAFEDFRNKVGTFDDKGQLIRRIASFIDAYHETSFVPHGADPFAQKVNKEGKIVNPGYAVGRDSFSEGQPEGRRSSYYYFSDFKTSLTAKSDTDDINILENEVSDPKTKNSVKMKKELLMLMALLSGITLSDADKAIPDAEFTEKFNFEGFYTQLEGKQADLTTLSKAPAELADVKAKLVVAEKFKTDNEAKLAEIAIVDSLKATTLKELNRVTKLVTGKEASAELTKTYEGADLKTLQAFLKPLEEQLNDKFPLKCAKCDSLEVNRGSAEVDEPGKDKPAKKTLVQTREEFREKFRKNGFKDFIGLGQEVNK